MAHSTAVNTTVDREQVSKRVSIIGAGAAGCFCAIELKRRCPECGITIYEQKSKALAKVAITGGGRCNLTNTFEPFLDDRGRYGNLQQVYPRGDKLMRKVLTAFSHNDTMRWFENEGVRLVCQDDGCVFPQSQDAMEIVNTLLHAINCQGIKIQYKHKLTNIEQQGEGSYLLSFDNQDKQVQSDVVVIATGGGRSTFLEALKVKMQSTIPSLFTLNTVNDNHESLMGTVVKDVTVTLAGTAHHASGALLWTHHGVSGPAILRLSSYAARELAEQDYRAILTVNWCGGRKEEAVRGYIADMMREHSMRLICNEYPTFLTQKHWNVMLDHCSIPQSQRWGALNKAHINRLVNVLTAQQLTVSGRNTYKEEFVTAGGVSLKELQPKTLEHRCYKGLYFAGEVTDVDAITGGFNLQAAWSMGWQVAVAVSAGWYEN